MTHPTRGGDGVSGDASRGRVRLELYASERHYLEHLVPLARAVRGAKLRCGTRALGDYAVELLPFFDGPNVPEVVLGGPPKRPGVPVVVASKRDARRVTAHRQLALLEHGAGQTYIDQPDHGSYAGGEGWEGTALVLSPGPHSARAWRAVYPDVPVVELQGSPRLDRHVLHPAPPSGKVVFSFHWDNHLVPETRATWRRWRAALMSYRHSIKPGVRPMLGHAHPRLWATLAPFYRAHNIYATDSFDVALAQGWLYVCDNSSTMYEWAGLGRPVLCLNDPSYRRDVEHGLRFWSHPPGLQCDDPEQLAVSIAQTLDREPITLRHAACMEAYGVKRFDGQSTLRAAQAIEDHLLA